MKRLPFLALAALLGTLFAAGPGLAQETKAKKEKPIPNMVGVWKGTSEGAAMGALGHVDAAGAPTFVKVDWTLTIDKQEGRAFYGTKASSRAKETVVGVVDGAQVGMADDDGTYVGKLTSPNRLIVRYLEAGKASKAASVTLYVRERDPEAGQTPSAAPAQ
jgi:hypothetical protein